MWCSIWWLRLPVITCSGLGAGDVGRAEHLPDVPLAAGLALDRAPLEGLDALGEVPADDHRVAPQVADHVGGEVGGQGAAGTTRSGSTARGGRGSPWRPASDLAEHLLEAALELGVLGLLLLDGGAELEVVRRDAVLEEHHVDEVPERLAEVERVPGLVLVDAHDAVAEVVVLADDVRVGVVELVVAVLPLLGRRRGVPLPGGRVDLGVAHPVPLAVQDVVADLHVLQDLGDATGPRCRRSTRAGRC